LKSVDLSKFFAVDSSYKPLLYVGGPTERYAVISRVLQRPLQNSDGLISYVVLGNDTKWTEETVSNVIWDSKLKNYPIFPIQYTDIDEDFIIDTENKSEIFEVNLFLPRKSAELERKNSGETVCGENQFNNVEDDSIRAFFQQYSLSARGYDQEIKDLQFKSKQFSVETDFLANYFVQAWGLAVTENQTAEEILHAVTGRKKKGGYKDASDGKKNKRKRENNDLSTEDMVPSPLVYFNVEDEIVPILRSTILRVIPQSQLAIRVSGRWTDQLSDIDEDGNLIVRSPKEAFKHILASIQVHNPTREENFPLEIFVNEYSKHTIEETLDFLQITPHFIRFLDCEF
jgi:hypothetical protein